MRQTYIIMAAGAVLAAIGFVFLLSYPLLVGAQSVKDFQGQWQPAEKDAFKDYDEGDQVILKDTVAGVSYDQNTELTKVRLEGGSKGDLELYFEGKVYDNFAKDDEVLIETRVLERSGKEVLEGSSTSHSLAEDAITLRYVSPSELVLGGLGLLGLFIVVAGGVLYLRGWDDEAEEEDELEDFEQPPYGAMPGGASPQAPAPPTGGVTVACPTCQQPLMVVDPVRPLTVACPYCANPLMVQ